MAKPVLAIVGRPNVGKSMLFNKLTGRRVSIVEDTPGVTRDRIYGDCEWCGRTFSLVDTGGIEPGTDSDMLKFMRRQAEIAIATADVIVMVTDIKVGMTAADNEVATMLKRAKKPVIVMVEVELDVLIIKECHGYGPRVNDLSEIFALALVVKHSAALVEHYGISGYHTALLIGQMWCEFTILSLAEIVESYFMVCLFHNASIYLYSETFVFVGKFSFTSPSRVLRLAETSTLSPFKTGA